MTLKQKTLTGFFWSFIDQFANLGISFVVGIILARLLSPFEFGLIGMIMVFIAISESFINSGFSSALIRKNNCTQEDYSTVFFYNLAIGILFYGILYFSANSIAYFLKEPLLESIVQVMGLILIIDSLTLIQKTILTKRINFKLQAGISVIASVVSGVIAVIMAINGFGVWSLVAQRLIRQFVNSILLWKMNQWIPKAVFSISSFKELFGFGSKLLVSNLIGTIFQNIYYLVIGKYFTAIDLGYYTRAEHFKNLPSQNLNGVISRVSYPVLSSIQDDKTRLKSNYKKLIRSTMFITFILMLGMASVAEPMILTLIGEKWQQSIIYLQLLCLVGMLYPLHALNLNMLQLSGRSDLFLKLEIIKRLLDIPVILIGIMWGIQSMIIAMFVHSIFCYYLNSYWSGRFIGYSLREQLGDLLPSFILALLMACLVFVVGIVLPLTNAYLLIIQTIIGFTFVIGFCEINKFKDYQFIKELVSEKILEIRKK